jgi:uncharacterized Ntn-hydrolase superfamily protein
MPYSRRILASSSLLPLLLCITSPAGATYSIVATDQATQTVGGAVASCVGTQGVLIVYGPAPGKGGINAQAAANENGRDEGVRLLNLGTAPADIITQITATKFDSQYNQRQYGVADLQGRAAGFTGTGTSVQQYREDRQGTIGTYTYSVQGNVLTGVAVINQAESAFRGGGCDLAEKLILALEGGAKNYQGDRRCINDAGVGVPADAASIEVDLPGQPAGNYLRLSNQNGSGKDAVAQLRTQFNTWRQTHPCLQPDGGTSDGGAKDASVSDVISDARDGGDVSVGSDASDGAAGTGGTAGTAGAAGQAGAAGTAIDGSAGSSGTGGTGGAGGFDGAGGTSGTGGATGGSGGAKGGAAGIGGAAGTSGVGGTGGSGGAIGTGGASAGSAGASGKGGGAGSGTGGGGGSGGKGGSAGTGGTSDDGGCSCHLGHGSHSNSAAVFGIGSVVAFMAHVRSRRKRRRA